VQSGDDGLAFFAGLNGTPVPQDFKEDASVADVH
jgi:hypothetical protein